MELYIVFNIYIFCENQWAWGSLPERGMGSQKLLRNGGYTFGFGLFIRFIDSDK